MIQIAWAGYDQSITLPLALPSAHPSSMRGISERVAARWDLTLDDLKGQSRKRFIARPRQEAMWHMYQTGRFSLPQIGQFLGGRDHSTILHGVRRHAERIAEGYGHAA